METEARSYAVGSVASVVLLLANGVSIEGSVYLSSEPRRFSDAWEQVMRDARAYVALVDARTRAVDGSLADGDPFLLVRKDSIVAVRPTNED